ncbi:hypothetical protein UlMin_014293, partial [Ulmus minor]
MDAKANPSVILNILSLFLYLNIHICLGADTISANLSLSGDQTLVSAGGKSVLGFFKPGNSSKYYIGTWFDYKDVSQQTIVWVANRERSVSDRFSSELRISGGNLVLFNEDRIPIWSTNVSSNYSSVQAVLLDDGNLILNDGSNSSQPLWQSFDHRSYMATWHQLLTSWKSSEDPSPGLFSLELNANDSSYIILWNRSRQYWTSGSWDGQIFSLVPDMSKYFNNYNYVSNENESYFTFSTFRTAFNTSLLVMDVSGKIQQLIWQPNNGWSSFWSQPIQQCEVYAFCGAYGSCNQNSLHFCSCLTGLQPKLRSNYSDGCFRQTKLQCGSDRFLDMPSVTGCLTFSESIVLFWDSSTCLESKGRRGMP